MNCITFKVNGKTYSVGCDVSSNVTLLDYLRNTLELRGTKYMCREGGCGACIVLAERGEGGDLLTVNSCLVSITSCHGWSITTTEEVGNRLKGYSSVQRSLAEHNGTQCGYCSPAWVMSMTSLLKDNRSDLTMLDIEKSFASNICRCTGYRPILESFKTFAKDAHNPNKLSDIEDLSICERTREKCRKESCSSSEWCFVDNKGITDDAKIEIKLKDNKSWYKVFNVNQIFEIMDEIMGCDYMLLAGNTGKGAYPILEYPDVIIDISDIKSLKHYTLDQNLILGAGNTLTETQRILSEVAKEDGFAYTQILNNHLDLVAHLAVKNIGTIAGNLMLKYLHNEFPSDIFLLFETVGAMVTILDRTGTKTQLTLEDFLNTDMKCKVIINVELRPLNDDIRFITFKIMPRAQNAIARVNAGFLYKMDADNDTVLEASIVFGNINPKFIHAKATEAFLKGSKLFTNETLQQALKFLENELLIIGYPKERAIAKNKIALGLFYKGLLSLCPPDKMSAQIRSGAIKLRETRPVSQGTQIFDTNPVVWPLNKPMPKIEALIQCAGEAPYVEDKPTLPNEVYAAFVLSTVSTGNLEDIDATPALNLQGVICFLTAKDIPGLNSFTPLNLYMNTSQQEVLCSGTVKYYGQPIGIIVAESNDLAEKATKLVKIYYKNVKKPILDLRAVKDDTNRTTLLDSFLAKNKGKNTTKTIRGSEYIHGQYHFYMENQVCMTKPADDGLDVSSATQWPDLVQVSISQALNVDVNSINQAVRRIGGGFGGKVTPSGLVAVACSLVTAKLNRPCRMILPLTTTMRAIGKRFPVALDFEAGCDDAGIIQYINFNIYQDNGFLLNEDFIAYGERQAGNCYDKTKLDYKGYCVLTDTAKNIAMRCPASFEHIVMTEYIMEQICYALSLDPIKMRLDNMVNEESLKPFIETFVKNADYYKRKEFVIQYNKENRWKKRGLRFVPLLWSMVSDAYFNVSVAIYHGDGTVIISHGGIEMGQGINTKAVQVCAYTLNIPVEDIKVKRTNTVIGANAYGSLGSYTSESICLGVTKCCQTLLDRLEVIKKGFSQTPTWKELITSAFTQNVDLFASYNVTSNDRNEYNIYGAAIGEVEVDVLTGETQILRVDLIYDVGQSLSPEIDVGQIEGAFIMGQGYWTTEELVYSEDTGELLTDRTWNYHVPQARDIPLDFRVYFRRNAFNKLGVLGSKATGEPAICMSSCLPFAIREAITSSRLDSGISSTQWFNIDGAHTIDKVVLAAGIRIEELVFTVGKQC